MNSADMMQKIAELVLELDKLKRDNETLRLHNSRLVKKIDDLQNPKDEQIPTSASILRTRDEIVKEVTKSLQKNKTFAQKVEALERWRESGEL